MISRSIASWRMIGQFVQLVVVMVGAREEEGRKKADCAADVLRFCGSPTKYNHNHPRPLRHGSLRAGCLSIHAAEQRCIGVYKLEKRLLRLMRYLCDRRRLAADWLGICFCFVNAQTGAKRNKWQLARVSKEGEWWGRSARVRVRLGKEKIGRSEGPNRRMLQLAVRLNSDYRYDIDYT